MFHGEGYDSEELGLIGTEANLRYFEKVTPNYIDCGTDVDKFINICLQFLSKLTVFNFEFNNSETNLVRRLEK